MKLATWAAQWDILRINESLQPGCRWPRLERLLELTENFPRFSRSPVGFGIYLGWRDADRFWVYYHGICLPAGWGADRFGFGVSRLGDHGGLDLHSRRDIVPIVNVGDLPESSAFMEILELAGIGGDGLQVGSAFVIPRAIGSSAAPASP